MCFTYEAFLHSLMCVQRFLSSASKHTHHKNVNICIKVEKIERKCFSLLLITGGLGRSLNPTWGGRAKSFAAVWFSRKFGVGLEIWSCKALIHWVNQQSNSREKSMTTNIQFSKKKKKGITRKLWDEGEKNVWPKWWSWLGEGRSNPLVLTGKRLVQCPHRTVTVLNRLVDGTLT